MPASWLTVLGLATACSSPQPAPVCTPVQTKITLISGSGILRINLSLMPS